MNYAFTCCDSLFQVYSVRNQLCEKPAAERLGELSCNALQSMDTTTDQQDALYIVIDTNVFLSNLEFVEEVRDSRSEAFGRPFLVIPWTVLQVCYTSYTVYMYLNISNIQSY